MPGVILDTDFLSSFLKIGQLDLVRLYFQVGDVLVTDAVVGELARAGLLDRVAALPWVHVRTGDLLPNRSTQQRLGPLEAGETSPIALALVTPDGALLTNDRRADRAAARLGVTVLDIPGFLAACKASGLLDRESLAATVKDPRDKDHYQFAARVLGFLLS